MADIGGANQLRGAAVSTTVRRPDFGRALAQVGQQVSGFANVLQADQDRRESVKAVTVEGAVQRQRAEEIAGLDPLEPDYLDNVQNIVDTSQSEALSGSEIQSRRVQDQLQLTLTQQGQVNLASAAARYRQAAETEELAALDGKTQETLASIIADPDGFDAYITGLGKTVESISPTVNPTAVRAAMRRAGDDVIMARVEGLALARRYDEAGTFLTDAAGELSPGQVQAMRRRVKEVQAVHKQEFNSATDGIIADAQVQIIEAGTTTELQEMRAFVDQMEADGLFKTREQTRVSMIRAIDAQQRRLVGGRRNMANAQAQFAGDFGFDDQAAADLYWTEYREQIPEDATPEQRQALLDQFVQRGRMVPDELRRVVANSALGDNVDQLRLASEMESHFQAIVPGVDAGANPRTTMVQSLVRMGHDWQSASQLVIDRAPDQATATARDAEYQGILTDAPFDAREFIGDHTGVIEAGFTRTLMAGLGLGFGVAVEQPTLIPAGLLQEVETARALNYRLFGDVEAADQATANQVSRVYGISGIGGRRDTLMRHPPERALDIGENATPADQTEFLSALTLRAINAAGVEPLDREDGGAPFRLTSDTQTEREVRQGARPSYQVEVWSGIGDQMVPIKFRTAAGAREVLRLTVPDKATAQQLPEFATLQQASRQRETRLRDVTTAISTVAGVVTSTGAAIGRATGTPTSVREVLDNHPISGFGEETRRKYGGIRAQLGLGDDDDGS